MASGAPRGFPTRWAVGVVGRPAVEAVAGVAELVRQSPEIPLVRLPAKTLRLPGRQLLFRDVLIC